MKKIAVILCIGFLSLPVWAQLQTIRTYDARIVLKVGDTMKVFENVIHPAAELTSVACARYRTASKFLQTSPDRKMSKKTFDEIGLDQEIYNPFFYTLNKAKNFDLHRDFFIPMIFDEVILLLSEQTPSSELGKHFAKWNTFPEDRKKMIQKIISNPDMPNFEQTLDQLSLDEQKIFSLIATIFVEALSRENALDLQVFLMSMQPDFTDNAEPMIYGALQEFMKIQVVADCDKKKL